MLSYENSPLSYSVVDAVEMVKSDSKSKYVVSIVVFDGNFVRQNYDSKPNSINNTKILNEL